MISSKNVGTQTIERARALNATGLLHWTMGNFIGARPFLVEALRIGRQYQDKLTLGETLAYLGFVCIAADEYDSARLYLDESIELTSDAGNVGYTVSGMAHVFIGDIYLVRRDESRAMEFYEEGVRRLRETYNANLLAYAVRRLGYLAVKLGDCARAKTLFKESLTLNRQVGHQVGMAAAVAGLAKTALVEGRNEQAAQLYGIVEGRVSAIGIPLMVMDKAHFDAGVSSLREQLGGKTLARFWTKGTAMTLEQAIDFALKEFK